MAFWSFSYRLSIRIRVRVRSFLFTTIGSLQPKSFFKNLTLLKVFCKYMVEKLD